MEYRLVVKVKARSLQFMYPKRLYQDSWCIYESVMPYLKGTKREILRDTPVVY